MVSCLVMDSLMDGNRGVNNLGLNGLLVHDWLNGLVDVMMNMFTGDYVRVSLHFSMFLVSCLPVGAFEDD